MPTTTKGVWSINDVNSQINNNEWITYNADSDPKCLFIWGNGQGGNIGNNIGNKQYSSPVQIPGTLWKKVDLAMDFTIAIKSDGTLWAWGINTHGQLGQNDVAHRSSPVQIPGSTWCDMANGEFSFQGTSFGIRTDGTLWSWGAGNFGALGISTVACLSSPVQIPGTTWCRVSSGWNRASALRTDGTLWIWGCGGGGALGDLTITNKSSPVQIPGTTWCKVSHHLVCSTMALKTDNTLWAWGSNSGGVLGIDVGAGARSSPTQIPGSWCDVGGGYTHTLAVRTDGTLWSWGINGIGQLGVGDKISRSSPVQVPGTTWSCVSKDLADCHSMATKSDGTLWAWGYNNTGNLGDNSSFTLCRSSPIQIPGTGWSSPVVGYNYSGALKL